jgi:hypothetical protein
MPVMDRAEYPEPPARPNFTMRPALVVAVIALVILVGFSIGSAFTHLAVKRPAASEGATAVQGSSLRAVSARKGLSVIERNGQPPANVIDAITLPVGAVRTSTANPGLGASFDREVQFSVQASQAAVLGFYKTELHGLGWRTVTSGAATRQPGQQIVEQIAGIDGFYWELGVIVAPSTFSASGTTDITRFTLRLLQLGDEST